MELTFRAMRGADTKQSSMVCLVSPEGVVPPKHPLRRIKALADGVLRDLSPTFDAMYSAIGRPSIPPERLLKATLLMAFYTVRSERLLCEQLGYNLLFRWFLDMDMTEPGIDHSTLSRNRERLLEHDVAGEFFHAVVEVARGEKLLSDEHFSVDGTLIEAWASVKSFRNKDEEPPNDGDSGNDPANRWVNFHGEKRSNETHESKTDPEAKLMRKGLGKEAKLSYSAHALMENRNGLLVDLRVAEANGHAERDVALDMLEEVDAAPSITVGADKGYDTRDFVADARAQGVTPHVAQHQHARRRSAIDARTTRHAGYAVSQRIRMRIEEIFGWMKTVGGFRRTRFKGCERSQLAAYFVGAAYNLLRIAKLLGEPART
jgi:transposase